MLKVIVIGLGPIGIDVAKAVLTDRAMKLAGLVDVDSAKVGKSLGELCSSQSCGPTVKPSLQQIGRADIAIVTTTSRFEAVVPILKQCIAHGLHVVSSCEEMSFPWFGHKKLADEIDSLARKAGVALVGTGVNPGFVMDLLPAVLSSVLMKVTRVKVIRRLDAAKRRLPLQAKVGATMTVAQFRALARKGKIGHMGIGQSVAMLAAALGRQARSDQVKISLQPVIARRQLNCGLGKIGPGMVCGMRNKASWHEGDLRIELDLTMAVGVKDAEDRIELDGPVPLKAVIPGSTPGDSATVAALVNCARLLPRIGPGLKTMLDLPPASCRANSR